MSNHTEDAETLATNGEPLVQRSTLPAGTVLAGRYRLIERIGEGGMGDVYRATHLKIDKDVAIKVLAPEKKRRPRTVLRFLQEAKAASKIRHDNVVDITDYGESDGSAFFVMEYLAGEDLSFLLKRERRLPWSRTKPIVVQLLRALSAAHAAGIVHRDIKPHNCFITPRPGNPDFVKVIDFGIAKLYGDGSSEEQLTQTGAIIGTAEYMSPEQGMGQELDGRSDLYSVGIILYRMLTGEVPYKGNNPMAILYQHIHADRVPPSKACPEAQIDPAVDALVLRAMSRDREQRFASAEELIAAIEAIEVGGAAAGRSARPWWHFGVAALLLLGLVGAAWQGLSSRGSEGRGTTPPSSLAAAGDGVPSPAEPGPASADDQGAIDPRATPVASPDAPDPAAASSGSPVEPVAASTTDAAATPDATTSAPDAKSPDASETGSDTDAAVPEPGDDTDAVEPSESPGSVVQVRRSAREIRARLARVQSKVSACGKKAGLFPGESVVVALQITTDGRVSTATVQGAFSRTGARCIESAVRSVRFAPAQSHQSATHRFTL